MKHVIEAHDGFVSVRSAPGSGSSFSIVLPRPASAAEVPAAHYSGEQALERIPT
ncbi:MAG: hypothetical protein U0Z44_14925 [Kouleothrix sp.]